MKRIHLAKSGWDNWTDIRLDQRESWIASLPAEPAVFAVVFPTNVAYSGGPSDIGYIGCADTEGGLREAIRKHFPGEMSRSCHKSLYELVQLIPALGLGYRLISSDEQPREVADALIRQFVHEHGDMPVLNLEAAPGRRAQPGTYAEAC